MTPERKLRILEIQPKQQYYLQFLTDPCSEIQLQASEPCVLCSDLEDLEDPVEKFRVVNVLQNGEPRIMRFSEELYHKIASTSREILTLTVKANRVRSFKAKKALIRTKNFRVLRTTL